MKDIAFFIRNQITAGLYTVIYKGDYFFIDYWSFVHFFCGILIVLIAYSKRHSRPFFLLACLLFGWELLEISFLYFALNIFRPETLPDQFADIVIGFAGGGIGWLIWVCKQRRLLNRCRNGVLSLLIRSGSSTHMIGEESGQSAMIKPQETNDNAFPN